MSKEKERELQKQQRIIQAAAGREPADLVLKHAAYVNVFSHELCWEDVAITEGTIVGLGDYEGKAEIDLQGKILLPGFLDAHIHLESSLVAPSEFVKAVLPHGTTAVITDPHEIANVMGTEGIEYMMQATENLPVEVYFMLPSCVPATKQDRSGARLTAEDLEPFYKNPRVLGLAEMMDYMGVIQGEPEVLQKLADARAWQKRIDGHAPSVSGKALNAYAAAGIYSDHECASVEEAEEKLRRGQWIMIREGTAAQNLQALAPLLRSSYADRCLFCTDDKHPNDLLEKGHMDYIVKKAISLGIDPISAVQAVSYQTAQYFGLHKQGAIAPGYQADLVVIDDFEHFHVEQVYKKGICMYDGHLRDFVLPSIAPHLQERAHHTFRAPMLTARSFQTEKPCGVIGLISGEIISQNCGYAQQIDVQNDILKIAVIERHRGSGEIGIGYLHGYGLRTGAVATSISHDSHNVIVVGASEEEMAIAANRILAQNGGIAVCQGEKILAEVPLHIAGIMSEDSLPHVNRALESAKKQAFALGVSPKVDPFMTLSFMSLPVIPALRMTTQGVFDVEQQQYL